MSSLSEVKLGSEQAKSFFDPHSNPQLKIKKDPQAIEKIKLWAETYLGKSGGALLKKHQENFNPQKKFRLIHQESGEKLDKITLIEYAALFNNKELKELLNQAGFTYLFKMSNKSFLHRACFLGLEKLITLHLKEINDPNSKDESGNAPLHVVLNSPILTEDQKFNLALTLIEDDRVDVNKQNIKGETPLHLACSQGLISIVGLFVKLDDIIMHIKDNNSKVPLDRIDHLAERKKSIIRTIFYQQFMRNSQVEKS